MKRSLRQNGKRHAVTPGSNAEIIPGQDVPDAVTGGKGHGWGYRTAPGAGFAAGLGFAGPEVDGPGTGSVAHRKQVVFGAGLGFPGVGRTIGADLARGGNRDGLAGCFSGYGKGHAVTPGTQPRGVPGLDIPDGLAGNERDLGGCGARAGTLRTARIGFAGPEVDRPGTGGLLRDNQVPFGVGHGLPGVGGPVGEDGAVGGDLSGLAGGRSHHESHPVAPGTKPRGVPGLHIPHRLSGSERAFRSHFAGAGAGAAPASALLVQR